MMNLTKALSHILSEYGRSILQDSKRVEALLRDLCPEESQRRDVNLAIVSLKEGIPRELIAMNTPVEIVVWRLVKRLEDVLFIHYSGAKIAIETWALALNIDLPSSAFSTQSVAQSTVTSFSSEISLDQGVWTDPKTGLMWSRISIGQEWEDGQCIGSAQSMKLDQAETACQDFYLANFEDWRLPTIDELKGIMIPNQKGYATHTNGALINTLGTGWFLSETLTQLKDSVWGVSFNTGKLHKIPFHHYELVRAVRNNV